MVYGVWCMVYGVWCVWCMVYGVWCMICMVCGTPCQVYFRARCISVPGVFPDEAAYALQDDVLARGKHRFLHTPARAGPWRCRYRPNTAAAMPIPRRCPYSLAAWMGTRIRPQPSIPSTLGPSHQFLRHSATATDTFDTQPQPPILRHSLGWSDGCDVCCQISRLANYRTNLTRLIAAVTDREKLLHVRNRQLEAIHHRPPGHSPYTTRP